MQQRSDCPGARKIDIENSSRNERVRQVWTNDHSSALIRGLTSLDAEAALQRSGRTDRARDRVD